MKRRIDPVAILDVATYIRKQIEELTLAKNKLLGSISKISDIYQGQDANIIISKYQDRVKKINEVIINYENYALYMEKISGSYSNNLIKAKQKINSILGIREDKKSDIPFLNIEIEGELNE